MAKTTEDTILKVSDCHHGGLIEVGLNPTVDEEFEGKGKYICAVCRQPTKVLELIVEKFSPVGEAEEIKKS